MCGSSNTRDSKLEFDNDARVFVFLCQAFSLGVGLEGYHLMLAFGIWTSCKFEGGLRPPSFIMSLGIGLECYHLMLVFRIWACLVNLKVAFGHLLS